MTTATADALVEAYLKRLEDSLAGSPPERRQELMLEISSHIAQARAALTSESDAEVLTILERLGEPEEIAAEASDELHPRPPAPSTSRPGLLEYAAVLVMAAGGVLFPIAPAAFAIGAILVWRSKSWTPRQKVYAVYVPFVAGLGVLVLTAIAAGLADFSFLFLVGLLADAIIAPLGVAIYLSAKFASRAHWLVWPAFAIVAVLVYVPAAATLIPVTTYAYVGADGAPWTPAPVAGVPGCGGFYGTVTYAHGLALRAQVPVSVGLCWDGSSVRKTWGPDCFADYGPGLIVQSSCHVEMEPDGSVIVSVESSVRALTAPFFGASSSQGWRIAPNGEVDR